jgi:uncharacterized protein (TIGR01777 family)
MTGKRIVIGGATGLLGTLLTEALEQRGDTVVPLVRQGTMKEGSVAYPDSIVWGPRTGSLDPGAIEDAHAVVVLNGVGIGDKRWTEERKQAIRSSRVEPVGTAARAVATLGKGAPALIAASAIGIYGDRGDEVLTERSSHGDDFLAEICSAWEAAAEPAIRAGVRVVNVRTGIGLRGVLGPMVPLFKLGIGGRIGDGTQWWSWVAEADIVGGYLAAIDSDLSGPVNVVSPNPVTNGEFTKALGAALHRPTVLPVPKFGLKLRLGSELAETVGYGSQRVAPEVLEKSGFEFVYPNLDEALAATLRS